LLTLLCLYLRSSLTLLPHPAYTYIACYGKAPAYPSTLFLRGTLQHPAAVP